MPLGNYQLFSARVIRRIEEAGHYDYIYVSLTYIAEAAEIKDKEVFIESIKTNLTTVDEEKIMTLAEQWKQEGFKKGIEKGIEKGKRERDIEIARSLLAKGVEVGIISSATGLSSEEIKKLMS